MVGDGMKRLMRISAMMIAALFCFITAAGAADSYFELDGFAFSIDSEGKATIRQYNGDDTDVVIPDTLLNAPVVSIGDYAFYGSDITSVSFDTATHLENIGVCAFYDCDALSEVSIPADVALSYGSFQSCTALEKLTVADGIDTIPEQCFYDCSSLTDIDLPDSVTTIEIRAFGECDSIRYLYLSDAVTQIGAYAFENDENLIIRCNKSAYAYQYAKDNNIKVEHPFTYLLGDADGDGVVNIYDVTILQRVLAHMMDDPDGLFAQRGCVTGEPLDSIDVTVIQRYLARLETPYPVGETVSGYTSSDAV